MGKDKSGLFAPAFGAYAERLSHYVKLARVEVPAQPSTEKEASALLAKVAPRDWVVALDERGQLLSSVELSDWVAKAQNRAQDMYFIVGGDEGLHESVRARADAVLSLSKMTLPHRLARVLLAEQLYRAHTLLKGEPYHK